MEDVIKEKVVMPPPPYDRKKKAPQAMPKEQAEPGDSIFVNKSSAFMQDMMSKEE
jgi:hypothetical protein